MTSAVPVTLVTGFLGAGKTTVVRHLLNQARGRRFVVVENEFGDMGIDGSLLAATNAQLFELTEGCVCCTVRQDLVDLFGDLARRADTIDHVLIETSGLATPGPVMQVLDVPELRGVFVLDGVVTVVDATEVERDLHGVAACHEQIATADLLILNKVDRVDGIELARVQALLRALNPLARQVSTVRGQVSFESVLSLRGTDDATSGPTEAVASGIDQLHMGHHVHDHDVGSVAVEFPGEVDLAALDVWLGRLVNTRGVEVWRMKGVFAVSGDPHRWVFQGVRRAIEVHPDRPWGTDPRRTRFVFIGRGLSENALCEGIQRCMRPTTSAAGASR